MTGRTAFTDEEWESLREAPATAATIVITSERGGTFRETFALAKTYTDARKEHGESELLDQLVAAGPKSGGGFQSPDDYREKGLTQLRDAAALVRRKATPEEADGYRAFVMTLAQRVAEAHKERGQAISEHERAALGEIDASLTTT
jgi:hypothetical protein